MRTFLFTLSMRDCEPAGFFHWLGKSSFFAFIIVFFLQVYSLADLESSEFIGVLSEEGLLGSYSALGENSSHMSHGLSCESIPSVENDYFSEHLIYRDWTPELQSRVVNQFIKNLDKNKIYLLEGDVILMTKQIMNFVRSSPQSMRRECAGLEESFNLFVTRLNERFLAIEDYLQGPHFVNYETVEDMRFIGSLREERGYFKSTAEANFFMESLLRSQVFVYMKKSKVSLETAKSYIFHFYQRLKNSENKAASQINKYNLWVRYLKAFANGLDPHSKYLSFLEVRQHRNEWNRSSVGMGITLDYSDDGAFVEVASLLHGGAAIKVENIRLKDKFIAVRSRKGDWISLVGKNLLEVSHYLIGERGGLAHIKFMRENKNGREEFVVSMAYQQIEIKERRASMTYVEKGVDGKKKLVGLLRVFDFYSEELMVKDIERLIKEAQDKGVSGIILDLSNNRGGILKSAIALVGFFIPSGEVMYLWLGSGGGIKGYADNREEGGYYGPLVVLTNQRTASASEMAAGSLQDYNRAIVVGADRTFGKGSSQGDFSSPSGLVGDTLLVTTGLFYTSNGRVIQNHGVISDISFPILPDFMNKFEENLPHSIIPPKGISQVLNSTEGQVEGGEVPWKIVDGNTIASLREKSEKRFQGMGDLNHHWSHFIERESGEVERLIYFDGLVKKNNTSGDSSSLDEKKSEYLNRIDVQEAIKIMVDYVDYIGVTGS